MSSDPRNDLVCDCVMCDALRFRLESAGHSYNRVPFDFLHVPPGISYEEELSEILSCVQCRRVRTGTAFSFSNIPNAQLCALF